MVTRRTMLTTTAVGAAAALAACAAPEPRARAIDDRSRKTYVLLHGAWHGGWCWKRVARPLLDDGHRVYTPTQTGLGERAHLLSKDVTLEVFTRDLVGVLESEDLSDVILVAHSFGGVAACGAADRVPQRLRHIVFLDSLLLPDGQSPFDAIPADVAAARRKAAQDSSGGLSMPVPPASAFGVVDPADAAWLQSKCTPHPIATYESRLPLRNALGNGIPATYVAVTPAYGPTTATRQYARSRKDWRYVEIAAGHDAMVTSPQAVLDIVRPL